MCLFHSKVTKSENYNVIFEIKKNVLETINFFLAFYLV